jgi:hypothetical protein
MAAAAGVGGGLNILGGIMGSVGDILAAEKYKRPKLPPATGYEQRLRQLAQNQLIGGGQELLQGQALYNQMTPILLGMLPGMTLTPRGTAGVGGATGTGGAAGTTAGTPDTGTPMTSYSQALSNYQQAVGRNQQLSAMNKQLKVMKKGPDKKALRQQRNALRRQKKAQPPVPDLERQMYMAGSQAPTYDISVGTANQTDAGPTANLGPSAQSTLAQIMGYLHGSQDAAGTSPGPSFLDQYRTGLTSTTPSLPTTSMTSTPTTTGY